MVSSTLGRREFNGDASGYARPIGCSSLPAESLEALRRPKNAIGSSAAAAAVAALVMLADADDEDPAAPPPIAELDRALLLLFSSPTGVPTRSMTCTGIGAPSVGGGIIDLPKENDLACLSGCDGDGDPFVEMSSTSFNIISGDGSYSCHRRA